MKSIYSLRRLYIVWFLFEKESEEAFMEFIEKIKQFSERVSALKDTISTEEATKMSLIVPVFQILGYDL